MRLLSTTTLVFFLFAAIASTQGEAPGPGRVLNVHGTKTSYALARGATSLVIRLRDRAEGRNFIFVNENAAAQGELSIAVSNQSLAADSPDWSAVEGKIRFRHKRLFTVSLVGVEAKYVRLTFRVEMPRTKAGGDRPRRYRLARIASS